MQGGMTMRKFRTLLLVACFAGVLAGCGSGSGSPGANVNASSARGTLIENPPLRIASLTAADFTAQLNASPPDNSCRRSPPAGRRRCRAASTSITSSTPRSAAPARRRPPRARDGADGNGRAMHRSAADPALPGTATKELQHRGDRRPREFCQWRERADRRDVRRAGLRSRCPELAGSTVRPCLSIHT